MDIDPNPRNVPRDSRGRFSGAPFATAPQPGFSAPRPGAPFPTTGPPPGFPRLPPAPGSAALRRAPVNPQAFPAPRPGPNPTGTSKPIPARLPPRPTVRQPAGDRRPPPHTLRLTASGSLAKQIREAATNTQVTLRVEELMDLCPAVRQEFRTYTRLQEPVSNFVDQAVYHTTAYASEPTAYHSTAFEAYPRLSDGPAGTLAYQAERDYPSPVSVARVKATIHGCPQTVIIDSGCSGVMMGVEAVRQCNLISRIDRRGAEQKCFRVANGTPLGMIRDVSISVGDLTTTVDVTVCAAETTDILLGVKFLAQVDGVLRMNPPLLEMTNSQLQRCSAAVDYSGDPRLHQFAYSWYDENHEAVPGPADHSLTVSSEDEAQLQYASDSEHRENHSHIDYVLSATQYAGSAGLARLMSLPRHQRDVSDWQLRPDMFRALQAKVGPFTVDACCDSEGANAQLPDYWFAPPGVSF